MDKTVVRTTEAPGAIGPYSQAVCAGGFVFLSGQIALDPASGQLVGNGDVEAETRQVLANLKAVLAAAGSSVDAVVRATIYLTDLADFGKVNALYGEVFAHRAPARSTVQVAGLPRGARVEIDLIAGIERGGA
jgi:2-iminobutanoate/2-iminopropanoate deaminase